MTYSKVIQPKYICATCGKSLTFQETRYNIVIVPCTYCIEEAKEEAYREVEQNAYSHDEQDD